MFLTQRPISRLLAEASFVGVLALSAAGCSEAPSDARSGPDEPIATSTLPLLNVNNEYLQYGTRTNWTGIAFWGDHATGLVDVTGDGKADAVAVNNNGIFVRRSNGSSFLANETWRSTAYWGDLGTFFADVSGDGKADTIIVDLNDIGVRRSNGTTFGGHEVWSSVAYYGDFGTFFADVTGDGKADAIVVNSGGVVVRRSDGTKFLPNETWTTNGFWGDKQTAFADVTGDGKADAIAVNNDGIYVRPSTGSGFGPNEKWTPDAFYGSVNTLFADATADGVPDAIAVNADGVWMRRSGRFSFGRNELLAEQTNLGTPLLADVTGDHRADIVEIASSGLQVTPSRDRVIKVRFVELSGDSTTPVTSTQFDNVIAVANRVYAAAGLRFTRVATNVVNNTLFSVIHAGTTARSKAELKTIKDTFNSACGIDPVPQTNDYDQLAFLGARCALPGEVLVFVVSSTPFGSTGLIPWIGKSVVMTVPNITESNQTNGIFAHELGHFFGLPHVWDPGPFNNPETNSLDASVFWDLFFKPGTGSVTLNQGFRNQAEATAAGSSITPIQSGYHVGWWCPGDPGQGQSCSAGAPVGTIVVPVSNALGQSANMASGSPLMKGLGLRLPNLDWTMNVMATDYPAVDTSIQQRTPALSMSQIEMIRRVLTFDVPSQYKDGSGNIIYSNRQLLGR